jgi:hypothetical protein
MLNDRMNSRQTGWAATVAVRTFLNRKFAGPPARGKISPTGS